MSHGFVINDIYIFPTCLNKDLFRDHAKDLQKSLAPRDLSKLTEKAENFRHKSSKEMKQKGYTNCKVWGKFVAAELKP